MRNPLQIDLKKILLVLAIVALCKYNASAQWITNGPANMSITCIVASGSYIFAGTNSNGVYVSDNNGTSWTAMNTGLTATNVLSMTVSDTNIFAGTNGGVFLSTNMGVSWTAVNSGLQSTSTVITALTANGSNIFAGVEGDGVYKSVNNGSSWVAVNNGLTTIFPTSLITNNSVIYAASQYGGVFISNDNGGSWTAPPDSTLGTHGVYAIAASGSNIFAGTSIYGMFSSQNNGVNWKAMNNDIPLNKFNIFSLAVSGSYLFAGTQGDGLFYTTNNGSSWIPVDTGLSDGSGYITSLAVVGSTIFAGTNGNGVWQRSAPNIATGVQEIKPTGFMLYPNPSNGNFVIETNSRENKLLQVFDITGKIMFTQNIYNSTTIINTASLAQGIYTVRLTSVDGVANSKLVIER